MRTFIAPAVLLVELLTAVSPLLMPITASAAYSDVTSSVSEREAISALSEAGVLEGYADGTFRPSATINRAEFLKILLESRGNVEDGENCFPDVKDEWFASYVCAAKSEDIVRGYPDGNFRPQQPISFVEAAKMLSRAYDQPEESSGGEWYERYVRALEAAKAIPVSIDAFDKALTRGEMAEMMWRLKNGITDRESKGFLNVKYAGLSIDLSSDEPQKATRCMDLAAFTEEETRARGQMYDGAKSVDAPTAMPAMDAESGNAGVQGGRGGGGDYSQTNVQVQGVDEADIVKTDGMYIYMIRQTTQNVHIIKAVPGSDLKETSKITFAGGNFNPSDLYVEGDRLVVIGNSWNAMPMLQREMDARMAIYPPYWNQGQSTARIYDVSNHAKPELVRTVSFEGSLISTRRIDDKLYLVVNQGMRYWGGPMPLLKDATEEQILPTFSDSALGDDVMPVTRCGNVTILPHVPSPQYLTVGVVDIDSDNAEVKRTVILGRGDTVYSSEENLYVATQDWSYRWDPMSGDTNSQQTRVYRFSLGSDGATFEAKGSVEGRLLNQFSMDEHENTFRVATTTDGNFSSSDRSNNLFILNSSDMQAAGEIRKIAPGEQIYSVRFMGDRAYMVTFKTVDPLFVIDTSNPRAPKILGELKIPGYSSYLHPVGDNYLIGFGKEVDETQSTNPDAITFNAIGGVKLGLFDVSDVSRPKEIAKEVIGERGSESPLLYDHRSLFFDAERKLLAFPVTEMRTLTNPNPSGPWDKEISVQGFQGAYVYSFDTKTGFRLLGRATHYKEGDCQENNSWIYCYGRDVQRILRIGETLYTVSDGGVQSHALRAMTTSDELRFPSQLDPVVYPTEGR